MKTELKLAKHSVLPGQFIVEIWHNGQFIGQVCGADGPGVRIVSKHGATIAHPDHMITEVLLGVEPERTLMVCSKCGKTNKENKSKYCGDGSDKDNEHRWVKPVKIEIVEAGVGPGHPHTTCDRCGVAAKFDEEGHSDLIATCTHTEYVTLCEKCYRKAGNSVR